MTVRITLEDTTTGEQRIYIDTLEDERTYDASYIWSDGNYSCDCNRYNFFYGSEDSVGCGDTRFKVIRWEPE